MLTPWIVRVVYLWSAVYPGTHLFAHHDDFVGVFFIELLTPFCHGQHRSSVIVGVDNAEAGFKLAAQNTNYGIF